MTHPGSARAVDNGHGDCLDSVLPRGSRDGAVSCTWAGVDMHLAPEHALVMLQRCVDGARCVLVAGDETRNENNPRRWPGVSFQYLGCTIARARSSVACRSGQCNTAFQFVS